MVILAAYCLILAHPGIGFNNGEARLSDDETLANVDEGKGGLGQTQVDS